MCDDAGHKKPTGQVVCTKGPDLSGKYMTHDDYLLTHSTVYIDGCTAITQNPNTKNARPNRKIHWRFVRGIQTRYCMLENENLSENATQQMG